MPAVKLTRQDIEALIIGKIVRVGAIELYADLPPISGWCRVDFTRFRTYIIEWPVSERRKCLRTIRWYLRSGARFWTEGYKQELKDPEAIVDQVTIAFCGWALSKNPDKPSPHQPWKE